MAILSKNKRRVTKTDYTDGVSISIRTFEDDERERYHKEFAKIAGRKSFGQKLEVLIVQVAMLLVIDWSGIDGEDGKPVPISDEAKKDFLADPEMRKYWYPSINTYLFTSKKGEQEMPDESTLPEAEDPNFLAIK